MSEEQQQQEEISTPLIKKTWFWVMLIITYISSLITFGILSYKNIFETWTLFIIWIIVPVILGIVYILIKVLSEKKSIDEEVPIKDITKNARAKCREITLKLIHRQGHEIDFTNFDHESVNPEGGEDQQVIVYSLITKDKCHGFYWLIAMRVDNPEINIILRRPKLSSSIIESFEKEKRKIARSFRESIKLVTRETEDPYGRKIKETIREPVQFTQPQAKESEEPLGTD